MILDVVIVNWNTGLQLAECIQSLAIANRGQIRKIVVVDNASTDGSAFNLPSQTLPLEVVHNSTNRGFAAACNQGARCSDADFILFLNPDTALEPDSLSVPLRFMCDSENSSVGISSIQLVDDEGRVSRSCSRFPTPWRLWLQILGLDRFYPSSTQKMHEWDHRDTRSVDQVIGAFFLIRRSLFDSLGGFDERFFVYFEEVDLSFRARKQGFSSYFLTDARAFHKGGGSTDQIKATRLFYVLRSRILYSYKHFGVVSATGVLLATLFIEPFTRLIANLGRGSLGDTKATFEGYWFLVRALCMRSLLKGAE